MAYNGRLGSYTSGTHGGAAAYGKVPGQTALPDPSADLAKVFPNLTNANSAVSGNILNELNGQLSPGTISNIQDNAANFGVSSGMPGSQFSGYRGLRNLGIQTQDLQRQGLQDFNAATSNMKSTQTVAPETQIGLDQSNKVLASAPDPQAAAAEQQRLFDSYLGKLTQNKSAVGPYSLDGLGGFSEANFLAANPDTKKISLGTYATPYKQQGWL